MASVSSVRGRLGGGPGALIMSLHALFFVAAATQTAIVPLLPHFDRVFHLTPAASAFLLAAPGLATLLVSMPAGLVADRLGAKRMTILATVLLCVGGALQALPAYAALLLGRAAFGLAYGTAWTTGVAWLAGTQQDAGGAELGAVTTSAAVGMVAGPAIGGVAADAVGSAAPFLIVAALAAVIGVVLSRQGAPDAASSQPAESLLRVTREAPRHPGVVTGACALAITGSVGGVSQLLVPLQLHAAGITASGTGIAFSAAAGVYIAVSGLVVRLGQRLTTSRAAALAAAALSLTLLPASISGTVFVLVAVLIISTIPRALVSTVAYPLATGSAAAGGELGPGAVVGLLNGTWALGLVVAPLVAGGVDGAFGPAPAYLSTIVPAALGAAWLVARNRRGRGEPAPLAAG